MTPKTLFYSWQSDLDPKANNYLIRDALKAAIKTLEKEIDVEMSLDKDTQETSGSPDIVDTIFRKIRAADILVADVTIINADYDGRKTPNPNVMIELGYAVKALGWERIICIVNTDYCRPEDLPFDVRNNRTSTYSVNKAGVKEAEKTLTGIMVEAIRAIVDNYDKILKRFRQDDYIDHDKALFGKFDAMASQVDIFDSLDLLCTSLSINKTHYRLWDRVEEFRKSFADNFLSQEIQASFEKFARLLDEIHLLASQKLFSMNLPGTKTTIEYEEQGIEITPAIQYEIDSSRWYKIPDSPADGDWNAYSIRVGETQALFNQHTDEIMAAYKEFRLTVKKHLFI
jgi:hypothetical protein